MAEDGDRAAERSEQSGDTRAHADVLRRRRRLLVVGAVLAAVALVAFAVLGVRSFTKRLSAAEKIDRAADLVTKADAIVVGVDEVVRAKMTAELAEKAQGAASRVDEADALLADALELIDAAERDLNDDEREKAVLLRESAQVRREMLALAPPILEANTQAASALPRATEAWQATLDADKRSDRAVAAYNKLTRAGVKESRTLNREAEALLATAREGFSEAEEAFPAAPFERYLAYVDARFALNRLSRRSDNAWLDGEIASANSTIAEYNREDRRAVTLAKKLLDPQQAIADAFEEATGEATDSYYAAREKALTADQRLREY